MFAFNPATPIFVRKPSALTIQPTPGLWRVHWQIKDVVLYSSFYTKHDQACLLWSVIAAIIFVSAQFLQVNWVTQTTIAAILTSIGVVGMVTLTWRFSILERLRWVLGGWTFLMGVGVLLTCASIFLGWGQVLMNICPLWLGLSALGYGLTGVRMKSRMFFVLSLFHLLAIALLPYAPTWQALITGVIISGSAFSIAEFQWDAEGVCVSQAALFEPATIPVTNQSSFAGVADAGYEITVT